MRRLNTSALIKGIGIATGLVAGSALSNLQASIASHVTMVSPPVFWLLFLVLAVVVALVIPPHRDSWPKRR